MTNGDRIRAMNDKELAKLLASSIDCGDYCKDFGWGCDWDCKHHSGYDVFYGWLKEEVEE